MRKNFKTYSKNDVNFLLKSNLSVIKITFIENWKKLFLLIIPYLVPYFDAGNQYKSYYLAIGLSILLIILIVSSSKEDELHEINRLKDRLCMYEDGIDIIQLGNAILFNIKEKYFNEINLEKARITLFINLDKGDNTLHHGGRISDNKSMKSVGRRTIPIREGCVGEAWQVGKYAYINNLPVYENNSDSYVNKITGKYDNISPETIKKLRFHPKSIYSIVVNNDGQEKDSKAVIVLESLEKSMFVKSDLEKIFHSINDDKFKHTIIKYVDLCKNFPSIKVGKVDDIGGM